MTNALSFPLVTLPFALSNMLFKTDAMVLRTVKYGDRGFIVDVLTPSRGRLSFMAQVSASRRGRLSPQLFQPLTVLEVVVDERPGKGLARLREARIERPFAGIMFSPAKVAIALFLAEFLVYATRDSQPDKLLYQYVETSLAWLDNAQEGFANFHLVFMMRLSRFVGFFPNLTDYRDGDYFDLREALFTPLRPAHRDFLMPDDSARLRLLMRLSYATMSLFAMNGEQRSRTADIIVAYYRLHLPGFPELKSLEVLRGMR